MNGQRSIHGKSKSVFEESGLKQTHLAYNYPEAEARNCEDSLLMLDPFDSKKPSGMILGLKKASPFVPADGSPAESSYQQHPTTFTSPRFFSQFTSPRLSDSNTDETHVANLEKEQTYNPLKLPRYETFNPLDK